MNRNIYRDVRAGELWPTEKTFAEWPKSGMGTESIVADPQFMNAGGFDFRLRREAPALKVGFHEIDMSGIGTRGRPGPEGMK